MASVKIIFLLAVVIVLDAFITISISTRIKNRFLSAFLIMLSFVLLGAVFLFLAGRMQ